MLICVVTAAITFARLPNASKSTPGNFATWAQKANCCACSSPLQDDNEIQFTVLVQKIPSPPSTIEGGDGSQKRQGTLAAPRNMTTLATSVAWAHAASASLINAPACFSLAARRS